MHPILIKESPVGVYTKSPFYVQSDATETRKRRRLPLEYVMFYPPSRRGLNVGGEGWSYNLWDGLEAEKLPRIDDQLEEDALNSITLDFIGRTMMDSNAEHLEFYLDWMANPVVQPVKNTKVAVIFSGPKGGAHHIFLEFYRTEVLGEMCTYHTRNAKRDIIDATRRAHYVYSVMNQIDGIKGGITDDGVLRRRIVQSSILVDCKRRDKCTDSHPNITNFVLTTDKDSDIVLQAHDKLFVAYKVSPFTGDEAALRRHFDDRRTARAFYQLLKRRDVAKYGMCFQDGRSLSDFYTRLCRPAADTAAP